MCTIFIDQSSNIVEGYKVVAVKDGEYYSSFTGEKFTVGDVPFPPKYCKRLSDHWNVRDGLLLKDRPFYNSNFVGYTSAFIQKEGAIALLQHMQLGLVQDGYTLIIVKVVFRETVKGEYNISSYVGSRHDCIAGKYIISIEPCE